MKKYKIVHILPVTACFSEGDEHSSAWSLTKRLLPIDCLEVQAIAFLSKRLLHVSDQAIGSESNRLPYADYGFLSLLSLLIYCLYIVY